LNLRGLGPHIGGSFLTGGGPIGEPWGGGAGIWPFRKIEGGFILPPVLSFFLFLAAIWRGIFIKRGARYRLVEDAIWY